MRSLARLFKLHLLLSGVLLNVMLLGVIGVYIKYVHELQLPLSVLAERTVVRLDDRAPALANGIRYVSAKVGVGRGNSYIYGAEPGNDPGAPGWKGWGASSASGFLESAYDERGRPLPVPRALQKPPQAEDLFFSNVGGTRLVSTDNELAEAVRNAAPGDRILLAPGDYSFRSNLEINTAGTEDRPITLGAGQLGEARILVDAPQGFLVRAPYWVFENLDIQGVCTSHSACEHAFHIVGAARNTVIRNNRLYEFNSAIKVNGESNGEQQQYPDHGLLESNTIYNTAVRNTANPVTPVDIVAANGWVIRNHLIADFAKGKGDRTSYAAFAKGGASDTRFERNLVVCQLRVPAAKDVRVGLSFGGGGTDASACRDFDCSLEHVRGVMKNNIVMHCPKDVGIYLNKADNAEIYNNTLYNTLGIDVRFAESTAVIFNNILSGRINDRDGALSVRATNLVADYNTGAQLAGFHEWFQGPDTARFALMDGSGLLDRGTEKEGLKYDFCGNPRSDSVVDIGAIEYSGGQICDPLPGFTLLSR